MTKHSLMKILMTINDPRAQDDRLKHKLEDVLAIVFFGLMSACEDWEEIRDFAQERQDWLHTFLELPNGIPSADTLARVVGLVSFVEIEKCVRSWVSAWSPGQSEKRDIISLDGKTLSGSRIIKGDSRSALIMVSAILTESGICLASEHARMNKKEETERNIFSRLIESLNLKGAIVTMDANGATHKIASQIEAKGADWLLALKKNQKGLFSVAQHGFAKEAKPPEQFIIEEQSHGRREKRTYTMKPVSEADTPDWHKGYEAHVPRWTKLRHFIRVACERTVVENAIEKTQTCERYFFTSLDCDVKEAARVIRSHWSIENKLNWTLDVAFREDHWRARARQEAENLAAMRRLALNMLKVEKTFKGGVRRKMKKCAMNPSYLVQVFTASSPH